MRICSRSAGSATIAVRGGAGEVPSAETETRGDFAGAAVEPTALAAEGVRPLTFGG
jgi:hypothetical protein